MMALEIHRALPVNAAGRDFVFGDLHGMTAELEAAMGRARFDPARDRLISTGDLIDRGPDSDGALALLKEPWFFSVLGNHEAMLLDAVETGDPAPWRSMGGGWAALDAARRWMPSIARLPLALTIRRPDGNVYGVIHAECPLDDWDAVPALRPGDAVLDDFLWARNQIQSRKPHWTRNVRFTLHGHTPIPEPLMLGNALFIDTGCVFGGPLAFLDLDRLPDLRQDSF